MQKTNSPKVTFDHFKKQPQHQFGRGGGDMLDQVGGQVARLLSEYLSSNPATVFSDELAALSGCFGLESAGFKNLTFIGRLSTRSFLAHVVKYYIY